MSRRKRARYHDKKRATIEAEIQERELRKEFWNEREGGDEEAETLPMLFDANIDAGMAIDMDAPEDNVPYMPKKCYVLDTNLILSCVNVLHDAEDKNWREPLSFKPDIHDAHLVIPMVVYDELDRMRGQNTFEGIVARIAFNRLQKFFTVPECKLGEILRLEAPVPTGWGKQMISLLPYHRDFPNSLPWVPSERDNDGWIAVTALAATMANEGLPVDGTWSAKEMLERSNNSNNVILLTKDKPLLGKARNYGVRVEPYSFKARRPYTGCRRIKVPKEMLGAFFYKGELSREEFERFLPDEPSLLANEYIIMELEGEQNSSIQRGASFSNIARYHGENRMLYPLRFVNHEGPVPPNAGIATYYDALNDNKIEVVLATGRAGTGKTYQAIFHAIKEVEAGRKKKIILFATQKAENPIGTMPGGKIKKMEHLVAAIKSVIASYLADTDEFKEKRKEIKRAGNEKQKKDTTIGYGTTYDSSLNRKKGKATKAEETTECLCYEEELEKRKNEIFNAYFECYPYENLNGITLDDVIIIIDEVQRMHDFGRLKTMATRGEKRNVKLIVCGDTNQIDKATPEKLLNNGVNFFKERYYNWTGFACVYLTENMRGGAAGYENRNRYEACLRIAGY